MGRTIVLHLSALPLNSSKPDMISITHVFSGQDDQASPVPHSLVPQPSVLFARTDVNCNLLSNAPEFWCPSLGRSSPRLSGTFSINTLLEYLSGRRSRASDAYVCPDFLPSLCLSVYVPGFLTSRGWAPPFYRHRSVFSYFFPTPGGLKKFFSLLLLRYVEQRLLCPLFYLQCALMYKCVVRPSTECKYICYYVNSCLPFSYRSRNVYPDRLASTLLVPDAIQIARVLHDTCRAADAVTLGIFHQSILASSRPRLGLPTPGFTGSLRAGPRYQIVFLNTRLASFAYPLDSCKAHTWSRLHLPELTLAYCSQLNSTCVYPELPLGSHESFLQIRGTCAPPPSVAACHARTQTSKPP